MKLTQEQLDKRRALRLIRKEKEIIAPDLPSYALYTSLALELLFKGVFPVARIKAPTV
jgi:hypothetical protein